MALSYADSTATAGQTVVSVPFPYLAQIDVHITIFDDLIPDVDLVWSAPNQITVPTPLNAGDAIHVYRSTPADDLLYVAQPGIIDYRQVNRGLLQLLYIVQEAYDTSIQARDAVQDVTTILDQVTALYNSIVTMHAEVVTDYDFISALTFYYNFAMTTPYPPSVGEKLMEYAIAGNSEFDPAVTTHWEGRMYGAVTTDVEVDVYKVDFDDTVPSMPVETTVLLGKFLCTANAEKFVWTTDSGITAPVDFASGDYLRFIMGGTTNSNITGFGLTARLKRTS